MVLGHALMPVHASIWMAPVLLTKRRRKINLPRKNLAWMIMDQALMSVDVSFWMAPVLLTKRRKRAKKVTV